jgi:hypothetical protein
MTVIGEEPRFAQVDGGFGCKIRSVTLWHGSCESRHRAYAILRGRRNFQPAFGTWYAAMLFAIVPLRNILPGAPPPGSWIDQAFFIWALIALVAAMVIYFVAWYRRSD